MLIVKIINNKRPYITIFIHRSFKNREAKKLQIEFCGKFLFLIIDQFKELRQKIG